MCCRGGGLLDQQWQYVKKKNAENWEGDSLHCPCTSSPRCYAHHHNIVTAPSQTKRRHWRYALKILSELRDKS